MEILKSMMNITSRITNFILAFSILWLASITSVNAQPQTTLHAGSDDGMVAIIRPSGEHFLAVTEGIVDDIDGDLTIIDHQFDKVDAASIKAALSKNTPNAVVLMGNSTIKAYKKIADELPSDIAVISVAALFIDRVTKGIPNSTGILYEIPAVTSFVNLRNTISAPVKRVGVLYRAPFKEVIKVNQGFTSLENIELIPITLPAKTTEKDLSKGLKKLSKSKLDAIWVTNDSGLLKPNLVGSVWLPFLKGKNIPVVVGVETLAKTQFNFGNFVVFPDHYGLGVQTTEVIFELLDNDWDATDMEIAQPISVKKHLNMAITEKRGIKVKTEALSNLDKIIRK